PGPAARWRGPTRFAAPPESRSAPKRWRGIWRAPCRRGARAERAHQAPADHQLRQPARSHHERFHRVVLRQAQLVDDRGGAPVALLDALPELAVVDARERRPILLALMLEDRADLEPQLLLRERDQQVGFGHRPFLPRATVIPDLGRFAPVALERPVDRFLAHAMGAVGIGEVARHQDDLGPLLLEQLQDDLHVTLPDRILAHLAGLVEGQIQETGLLGAYAQGLDRRDRLDLPDAALEHQQGVAIHFT